VIKSIVATGIYGLETPWETNTNPNGRESCINHQQVYIAVYIVCIL